MNAPNITPCPFCGDPDPMIDEVDTDTWAVCCQSCGCTGPTQDEDHTATVGAKAISLWNKRPREGLPPGIVRH
jgi:Lar family restriction alleviation protein